MHKIRSKISSFSRLIEEFDISMEGELIEGLKELLRRFVFVFLRHQPRQCNFVAYQLVKFSLSCNETCYWMETLTFKMICVLCIILINKFFGLWPLIKKQKQKSSFIGYIRRMSCCLFLILKSLICTKPACNAIC